MGYVKLSKRIELWGSSPGSRVTVTVYWPRYLWVKGPDHGADPCYWFVVDALGEAVECITHGTYSPDECPTYPGGFATLSEQLREHRRLDSSLRYVVD